MIAENVADDWTLADKKIAFGKKVADKLAVNTNDIKWHLQKLYFYFTKHNDSKNSKNKLACYLPNANLNKIGVFNSKVNKSRIMDLYRVKDNTSKKKLINHNNYFYNFVCN